MRRIVAIIRKDIRLRFAGPAEWLFFLILPIVFTVVLGGGTGAPADSRIRLVVADQSQSPLSAELIATLEKSEAVRPDVRSLRQAEDIFSRRQVSCLLVIPAGFDLEGLGRGQMELELRQQPNNLNAMIASQAVRAVIGRIGSAAAIANESAAAAERIRPFESDAARQAYFETGLREAQAQLGSAPDRVAVAQGAVEDEIDYDPRANSSAGQLITWVFIPLISISGMFAYERQRGTLRRLLTTPTLKASYLLGTIAGQVAMALVQMLLLIGFGIAVMKVNWGQSPPALAAVVLASTLAAAALGTTLGTFVKTEGQAGSLSIMLGMVMALLGGCWYPSELFPQVVRDAAKVLPTSWAMQGMLDIVSRGGDFAAVLPEAGVLLGFAALFFVVGIMRFRYE